MERKDPLQADSYHGWYAYVRAGFADRILGIDEETAEIWARITVPDPLPGSTVSSRLPRFAMG